MLVNLRQILPQAAAGSYSIACFNVFGYEDAQAIIAAAEKLQHPVILATNKDMAEQLGVKSLAGMLLPLIEQSTAEICLHLDHCYEERIIFEAIDAGYSSVMFDGSQLPIEENIARTYHVVDVARANNVSVEGEIGSVPYDEGRDYIKAEATIPEEAQRYAEASGIDAMAISVGNIHRLTKPISTIDYDRLQAIQALTKIPLVIHGTSGIKTEDLRQLKTTRVSKFNIGTTLRKVIGEKLREIMIAEPQQFDRQYFMKKVFPYAQQEAERMMQLLGKN